MLKPVTETAKYRDKVYAVTSNGVMSCYDLKSGKLHWAEDLKGGRGFRGSLVAGDGKVYAQPTWGPTAVIDATTAFWDAYLKNDADARAWLDGDGAKSVLEEKDRWQRK